MDAAAKDKKLMPPTVGAVSSWRLIMQKLWQRDGDMLGMGSVAVSGTDVS